jgi:hypothetical protein
LSFTRSWTIIHLGDSMASNRNPSFRPSPSISTATAKTRSAIRDLQTKLAEVTHSGSGPAPQARFETPKDLERVESEEDLERQLEAYFAQHVDASGSSPSHGRILDELRNRVIEGVVQRILSEWASQSGAAASALRDEVMARLIDQVLRQLGSTSGSIETLHPS